MTRRYDVVTFDCYGTLVDWESAVISRHLWCRPWRRYGVGVDRARLPSPCIWRSNRSSRLGRPSLVPGDNVLTETARRVAARSRVAARTAIGAGLSRPRACPGGRRSRQINTPPSSAWPLPATGSASSSNVDDDLLAETRRHLSAPFDLVVTAQQGRLKPAPAALHRGPARRIGAERWLHAAQSYFHDIRPAHALAIDQRRGSTARASAPPTPARRTGSSATWPASPTG